MPKAKWGDNCALYNGYTYTAADDKSGRLKKDPMEVIEELQRRCPNGANFASVGELKDTNADIAPRIKGLENKSKELLGMPFGQYLQALD